METTHAMPVGLWCHLLNDKREIQRQGNIIGLHGEVAFVQLFSFGTGEPTIVAAVPLATLFDSEKAVLYRNVDDMKDAWDEEEWLRRKISA